MTTLALTFAGLIVGAAIGAVVATLVRRPEPVEEPREDTEPVPDSLGWTGDPRVHRALSALPLGLVVTGPDGQPVFRNQYAEQFDRARHGDALVEAGLKEVIDATISGETVEQAIDLYGPPARNLQLRGSPTYDDGVLSGAIVVIEDVTAAQQIDRVRKDFVANVSHELRTPIGAIGVLAETLRDAEDPEVVDRLSRRLQDEALRLGDMIDDLLALSTLESGRVTEPELMDLRQVVEEAASRAAAAAEQREIEIECAGTDAGPIFVEGDQGQMVSAVANLLDNAIKYSDTGSAVTVGARIAEGHARLTVTDHGVGIPEADLDRIFERFYRVDDARSRATGGTGLGLSIVRHVVINHDGSISVESVEGQGSTFTLQLPLSPEQVHD